MDTESQKTPGPQANTTLKTGTLGRSRRKLVRERTSPNSSQAAPAPGPLTIVTANMTDTEVDRAINDANMRINNF